MRRLKLPKLPTTFPEPLSEEEIQRVLTASLDGTHERLRNFAIMMLFFNTGIRLDELVNLHISRIDFAVGEMTRKYVNMASDNVKEKHRRFSPMDNLNFRGKTQGRPKLKP